MKKEKCWPMRCPQNLKETKMTSDEEGEILKGFFYCDGNDSHLSHILTILRTPTSWWTRASRGKDDIKDFGMITDFPISEL